MDDAYRQGTGGPFDIAQDGFISRPQRDTASKTRHEHGWHEAIALDIVRGEA
ncbi:MAG: hypothetical protein ACKN9W_16285 [Methylococcus sp.]